MKKLFILWLAWMAWIVMSGCGSTWWWSADPATTVAAGDTIKVDYVWSLQEDGSVFDTSNEETAKANDMYNPGRPYEPLGFTVWAGQMIPGFDAGVVGMSLWENKKITILPADGYGERTDEAIQEIPSAPFEEQWLVPVVGEQYNFWIAPGTVIEIGSGTITVDFNHFLAGKTLIFDVTIADINKAWAVADPVAPSPAEWAE